MTGSPALVRLDTHLPPLTSDTIVITSQHGRRAATAVQLDIDVCTVVDHRSLQVDAIGGADRIVALGAGACVDTAKMVAHHLGAPLVIVPTVLSTDSPFSDVAAVRAGGTVDYVNTGPPEAVVLDARLLDCAPWPLHLRGLGDLLAIESATRDWEARHPTTGRATRAAARALVAAAIDDSAVWAAPTTHGYELLANLLRTKVGLGLVAGHPWAEEGTEHYLAYALEPHLAGPVWHGDLLMACLLVCAVVQDWDQLTRQQFGRLVTQLPEHPFGPGTLLVPSHTMRTVVRDLPTYCRQHDLRNTILTDAATTTTAATEVQAEAAWERGW